MTKLGEAENPKFNRPGCWGSQLKAFWMCQSQDAAQNGQCHLECESPGPLPRHCICNEDQLIWQPGMPDELNSLLLHAILLSIAELEFQRDSPLKEARHRTRPSFLCKIHQSRRALDLFSSRR